jgi:hypothetical protein
VLCLDADEDLASGVVAIHVETESVDCGVLISVEGISTCPRTTKQL